MKTFKAIETFHVHEWKAICSWFGNRGIPLEEGDILEWAYNRGNLYFAPSENAPEELTDALLHRDEKVVMCAFDNMWFEPIDALSYEESPFANKV